MIWPSPPQIENGFEVVLGGRSDARSPPFLAVRTGPHGLFGRRPPPVPRPARPRARPPPQTAAAAFPHCRRTARAPSLRAPLQCPCRLIPAARPLCMPQRPRPAAQRRTVSRCAQDAPLPRAAPPPRPCRRRQAPSWGGRGVGAPRRARGGHLRAARVESRGPCKRGMRPLVPFHVEQRAPTPGMGDGQLGVESHGSFKRGKCRPPRRPCGRGGTDGFMRCGRRRVRGTLARTWGEAPFTAGVVRSRTAMRCLLRLSPDRRPVHARRTAPRLRGDGPPPHGAPPPASPRRPAGIGGPTLAADGRRRWRRPREGLGLTAARPACRPR